MKRRMKKRNNNLKVWLILIGMTCLCLWIISNINIHVDTETINVGSNDTYEGIKATLFGKDISWIGKETGNVNTNKVGEYEIKYTSIFSATVYRKIIKVVDTQIPEITLNGDETVTIEKIEEFVEPGFIATDNYDGDITEKVTTSIIQRGNNDYEIEYSVMDSSGNEAITTRKIHIITGVVYLTFDDGPSLDITPQILDILKERDVKATFFVVGYGEKKDELIKREYTEGHTIALHGFSHDYSAIYTDINTLMNNFHIIEDMVKESTGGYMSKVIRFPGGSSNTVSKRYCEGIMTEAVERATEEGYIYFDWNVDSRDAGGAKNTEEVYQNVTSGIQPGRNNVILMHDFSGNDKTLKALKAIIDYCIENNYELRAITADTIPVQHHVAN